MPMFLSRFFRVDGKKREKCFSSGLSPDLAIMLIRNLSRNLRDFNDEEIAAAEDKISDEIVQASNKIRDVPPKRQYEIITKSLIRLENEFN